MRRIGIMVVLAGMLVACKGKDEASQSAAPSATEPTGAPAATAPTPAPAGGIDVCSLVTKEQVESVLGPLTADPAPQAAQGSLLGGCDYAFEGGMASVSARPAREFDGTVKASGEATELAGVGERAFTTSKAGVLAQPAGTSYFLHIFAMSGTGMDHAKAAELAKVVVPGAK